MRWLCSAACAGVCALGVSGSALATLEDGLVAKWDLDGNALDATGHGHDGTVNGATPVSDRRGKPAGAMAFDGDDYLSVPDDPAFGLGADDFTLATWIRRDAYGAGTDSGCYLMGHSDSGGGKNKNKWMIWLGQSEITLFTSQDGSLPVGSYSFRLNRWNHVAVRRQGDTLSAFVDGLPVGSIEYSLPIPKASQPLLIGTGELPHPEHYTRGSLDELRFYDRALSDAEVESLAPEPAALPLLALGGLVLLRRKR
jgi:hypothetical protein